MLFYSQLFLLITNIFHDYKWTSIAFFIIHDLDRLSSHSPAVWLPSGFRSLPSSHPGAHPGGAYITPSATTPPRSRQPPACSWVGLRGPCLSHLHLQVTAAGASSLWGHCWVFPLGQPTLAWGQRHLQAPFPEGTLRGRDVPQLARSPKLGGVQTPAAGLGRGVSWLVPMGQECRLQRNTRAWLPVTP